MGGKKIRGYTLVEFVAIIAIMMLLTALSLVTMDIIKRRIRDARRLNDVQDIKTALLMYKQEVGYYPAEIRGGEALKTPSGKVILAKVPVAPNQQDPNCPNPAYTYTQLSGGSNYTLKYCLSLDTEKYAKGDCYATPKSHCEKVASAGGNAPMVPPPTCSTSCDGLCGGALNGCGTPCNSVCAPETVTAKAWSGPEIIDSISNVYNSQVFKIKANSSGQVYLAYVEEANNYLMILARNKKSDWSEYGNPNSYQQIKANYLDFYIDKTTTDNKYLMLRNVVDNVPFPLLEENETGNFEFLYGPKMIEEYADADMPTINGFKGMVAMGSNLPVIDKSISLAVMDDFSSRAIKANTCKDSFKGIANTRTNGLVDTFFDKETSNGSIFVAYIAEEDGGALSVKRCDKLASMDDIGRKISNEPVANFKIVDTDDYPIFVYYGSDSKCLLAKKYKGGTWNDLWSGGCHNISDKNLYDVATNGSYLYLASVNGGKIVTEKYDLSTNKWIDKAINDFSDGGSYKNLSLEAYKDNLYIAYTNSATGGQVTFRAIE